MVHFRLWTSDCREWGTWIFWGCRRKLNSAFRRKWESSFSSSSSHRVFLDAALKMVRSVSSISLSGAVETDSIREKDETQSYSKWWRWDTRFVRKSSIVVILHSLLLSPWIFHHGQCKDHFNQHLVHASTNISRADENELNLTKTMKFSSFKQCLLGRALRDLKMRTSQHIINYMDELNGRSIVNGSVYQGYVYECREKVFSVMNLTFSWEREVMKMKCTRVRINWTFCLYCDQTMSDICLYLEINTGFEDRCEWFGSKGLDDQKSTSHSYQWSVYRISMPRIKQNYPAILLDHWRCKLRPHSAKTSVVHIHRSWRKFQQ